MHLDKEKMIMYDHRELAKIQSTGLLSCRILNHYQFQIPTNSFSGFDNLYKFVYENFFYRPSCLIPESLINSNFLTGNFSFMEDMRNTSLHPEGAYLCTIQKFCPDFEEFVMCMTENATKGCFVRKSCPIFAPPAYTFYSKRVMGTPSVCRPNEFFEVDRRSRNETVNTTEVGGTVSVCADFAFATLQIITKDVNFVTYFSLEVVGRELFTFPSLNNWMNYSSVSYQTF